MDAYYRVLYPARVLQGARLHHRYCGILVVHVLEAYRDWWFEQQAASTEYVERLTRQQLNTVSWLTGGLSCVSGAYVEVVLNAWGDFAHVSWTSMLHQAERYGWVERVCYPEAEDGPGCPICNNK